MLLTGAIWGGAFVAMKSALVSFGVHYLLALRFSIGAAGLCFMLFSKKHPLQRTHVLWGLACGVLLYLAYTVQTYALSLTTAGKNAMITTIYVVLVPFMNWWATRNKPKRRVLLAALLMLGGVALLSLNERLSINLGDLLTLCCGVLYAVHITLVGKYGKGANPLQFSCLQFTAAAVCGWVGGLCFETFPTAFTPQMLFELAYCGIGATLIALTLMNIGVQYTSPETASLITSTEAMFGAMFGAIFLNEHMTDRMLWGCALVMVALVVAQVDVKGFVRKCLKT